MDEEPGERERRTVRKAGEVTCKPEISEHEVRPVA